MSAGRCARFEPEWKRLKGEMKRQVERTQDGKNKNGSHDRKGS